ncbi:MAG: HAMP domain-containing histidine kinase [Clostridiales bacterium]|nr:HAMP domain-containing histidine kinase [Clostridiales bacterium]
MNIYDTRRYGTIVILAVAIAMVAVFLVAFNKLVNDLTIQERERMEVWASATRQMAKVTTAAMEGDTDDEANVEFLLSILAGNHTIPVLLTDQDGNIIDQRNFDLPEPVVPMEPLSPANMNYLNRCLKSLKLGNNIIKIDISPDNSQYLYYDDSKLLKRLGYYPYIQLLVMLVFIGVVYYALTATKRAEQNKVWVGLSKETAHQLGTPISSLMAWMEILDALGVDSDTVKEMNKDVNRLSTIASRFSKIGSQPQMESEDLNAVVVHACEYMSTRISRRITLTTVPSSSPIPVKMSSPLFEWVMENLIKNAVDAMEGTGRIDVSVASEGNRGTVTVSDTGKGISRKNFKTVFNPGYTTKTRGWGLGLTLAHRIIAQYHGGRIYVKDSEPGKGTTFKIELPM